MKTPPPDLPDTDDPWTLLGVDRSATPDEIRRAYLRRIKIYKPDLHPQAFRRLREAFDRLYEAPARSGGGFGGWAEEDAPPPADSIEDGWGRSAEPGAAESPPPSRPSHRADRRRADELLEEVRAARAADDRARAVEILLRPQSALLANDPRVAQEVVRVACSVVLSDPERFEELMTAFHDILLDRALEHRDGVLTQMRGAAGQWPAWLRATADLPVLSRFVELWGVLTDGEVIALGHEVAAAAHADPARWLATLDRAGREAPAVLELYVQIAHEWADRFGALASADEGAAGEGLMTALGGLIERNPAISRENLRRNLASVAIASVVFWVVSSRPWLWATVAVALTRQLYGATSDPTPRIYREALRPALVAWVWQGHEIGPVVERLRALVADLPRSARWFRPDRVADYPDLVEADLALAAHAATARLGPPR